MMGVPISGDGSMGKNQIAVGHHHHGRTDHAVNGLLLDPLKFARAIIDKAVEIVNSISNVQFGFFGVVCPINTIERNEAKEMTDLQNFWIVGSLKTYGEIDDNRAGNFFGISEFISPTITGTIAAVRREDKQVVRKMFEHLGYVPQVSGATFRRLGQRRADAPKDRQLILFLAHMWVPGSTSTATPVPGCLGCSAAKPLTTTQPKSGYLNRCVDGYSGHPKPNGSFPMKVIDPFSDRGIDPHRPSNSSVKMALNAGGEPDAQSLSV